MRFHRTRQVPQEIGLSLILMCSTAERSRREPDANASVRHSVLSMVSSLVRQSQSQLARRFAVDRLREHLSTLEPSPSL